MKSILFYLLISAALPLGLQPLLFSVANAVEAEESWKTEFNKICGQSDNAADLPVEALKKAIEQCDVLKPQIEALEATPRKVYLKRLQMCRNLFVYLLEGKEKR